MLMPIAWMSTIAFTIGMQTRLAHAISLVSTLALATHEVSSMPTWTHQNVPPLLASIAFLGGRGGDTLSVDVLVRRWRRRPPLAPRPAMAGRRVRGVRDALGSLACYLESTEL